MKPQDLKYTGRNYAGANFSELEKGVECLDLQRV
jgi:hypothetical protein